MTRRVLFLALAAATALAGPARAADFNLDSAIDAVTVFPRGATVVRTASGTLEPGQHRIIIDDLPEGVDPNSVRVEGLALDGVSIGSVDVRTQAVREEADAGERAELEERLETLRAGLGKLRGTGNDIEARRAMLDRLTTPGAQAPLPDAQTVLSLLDIAAARLDELAVEESALRREMTEVNNEIAAVERQLQDTAPRELRRTVVTVNMGVTQETPVEIALRYSVFEAGWEAVHDADLVLGNTLDDAQLTLQHRALVRQSTGEGWENVALSLSTARPNAASDAPDVPPMIIEEVEPQPEPEPAPIARQRSGIQQEFAEQLAASADMAKAAPMRVEEPVLDAGGFQAVWRIAGRTSVPNDRTDKSVTLSTSTPDFDLRAITAPRFDPTAYLQATLTHDGEAPLLPGRVFLSRNGTLAGQAYLPLMAPGQEHAIGFGADDFITVVRVEERREEGERGLLQSTRTDVRSHVMTIENRHDFVMPVTVMDRIPVANQEDIRIAMTEDTTPPDERNVEGKRGVLAWNLQVPADGAREIRFGYSVQWPADMEISWFE